MLLCEKKTLLTTRLGANLSDESWFPLCFLDEDLAETTVTLGLAQTRIKINTVEVDHNRQHQALSH